MLRRVKVLRREENGEIFFEPKCDPPFTVIEYKERVIGIKKDETGELIEIKEPYEAIIETPHKVGKKASWSEVENPIYFDIQIGDQLYSFRETPGAKRVGLDEKRRICRIVEEEKPYFVALDEEGKQVIKKTRKVRKLVPPEGDALAIRDGKLGILRLPAPEEIEAKEKFVDSLEEEFEDKKAGVKRRLGEVILKRDKLSLTLKDRYKALEKLEVNSHNLDTVLI